MVIVADSGSTKTDWAIIGKDIRYAESIGLNPFFLTEDQICDTIYKALSGIEPKNIEGIYFYGAGCGLDSNKDKLKACFRRFFPSVPTIEIDTDLLGSAIALFGKEKGIACILGTGANAGVYDGYKVVKTPKSLGYILGDSGSGSVLGLSLLRLYLQNKLPLNTAQKLEKEYDVDYQHLLENAYKKERPNKFFASFSPFVSQNRDCPVVRQMLIEQFDEFFRYFILPFEESKTQPIRIIGSVGFYYKDLLDEIAKKYDVKIDKVAQKPIELMAEFHFDRINK